MRVHRVDVGSRIRADMRTPQGSARIPANLTRTGVFNYPQPDGTVRREYRPPTEVFKADSLRTLETASVTIGHPGTVTPDNWRELAVGEVRGAKKDGRFIAADLVVRDKSTLDRIDAGELQELSCGYDCMLTMQAGVTPDGERYDAVQSDIQYNHVGLGPANWGRAGSEVRLRLDGGIASYAEDESERPRPHGMLTEAEIKALQDKAAKADEAIAQANAAKKRADDLQMQIEKTRTDGVNAEIAKLTAERDGLKGKLDGLEKQADPTRVSALVHARVSVIDGARLLHGKADIALDKTDREMMIAAIASREPEFKADGKSDEYVRARFDFAVEQVRKAGGALERLNTETSPLRLDGGSAGGDAELAALVKRFDSAPDRLEAYVMAEPWRIGEQAAMQIAAKVGG